MAWISCRRRKADAPEYDPEAPAPWDQPYDDDGDGDWDDELPALTYLARDEAEEQPSMVFHDEDVQEFYEEDEAYDIVATYLCAAHDELMEAHAHVYAVTTPDPGHRGRGGKRGGRGRGGKRGGKRGRGSRHGKGQGQYQQLRKALQNQKTERGLEQVSRRCRSSRSRARRDATNVSRSVTGRINVLNVINTQHLDVQGLQQPRHRHLQLQERLHVVLEPLRCRRRFHNHRLLRVLDLIQRRFSS